VAELQAVVDHKETKIERYLQRCDEAWLLIVADGGHVSSSLELPPDSGSKLNTTFTRVLLYDGVVNAVTVLK
jgi:hypothetical protein